MAVFTSIMHINAVFIYAFIFLTIHHLYDDYDVG